MGHHGRERLVRLASGALDHRRFWDAMDALDAAALCAAEQTIGARMVAEFGLELAGLALDMTNFGSFIDSANPAAPITQRGHTKQKRTEQKRTDLRIVGLGLVVTRDGGVPVFSHAYPGNAHDVSQFPALIDELSARHADVAGTGPG